MPAPSTSSMAPVLSWEKTIQQTKPIRTQPKKKNPLMILAVSAMVILAATGVWRSTHQAAVVKTVKIVTTRSDTAAGIRLGFMSLKYLDMPKELVTSDMVTSLTDAANHVTKTFVPAGEPLRSAMFFQSGQGLSQNLDTNERAITLKLDDDELVDHSIAPDDRVDVLVVSSKDSQKYAKTICQAARVVMSISKEQTMARHLGSNTNKITLAVSPSTAESISEAVEVGKIRLVLRNRLSVRDVPLPGAEQKDLLPGLAYQVDKVTAAKILTAPAQNTQLPGLITSIPSMPAPPEQIGADVVPTSPLQWMVQVFSGSKKETVGVPTD